MMQAFRSGPLFLLCAIVPIAGCSAQGNSQRISTVPVSGTVSLDGKPIAGATISFISTDSSRHSFMGATDSQGKYSLSEGANIGAQAGDYKVVIEYYTMPDGAPVEITPETDLEMLKKQGEVKLALPPVFSDPEQTELQAHVDTGKENVIDFELKSS